MAVPCRLTVVDNVRRGDLVYPGVLRNGDRFRICLAPLLSWRKSLWHRLLVCCARANSAHTIFASDVNSTPQQLAKLATRIRPQPCRGAVVEPAIVDMFGLASRTDNRTSCWAGETRTPTENAESACTTAFVASSETTRVASSTKSSSTWPHSRRASRTNLRAAPGAPGSASKSAVLIPLNTEGE